MNDDHIDAPLTHGGARPGAGRPPSTLRGLLKRLPEREVQKIRLEIRREARREMLREMIYWAGVELRKLRKTSPSQTDEARGSER